MRYTFLIWCNRNLRNCRSFQSEAYRKMCSNLNEIKTDATKVFEKAVESVMPHNIIRGSLKLNGNQLRVQNKNYFVNKNCYVVGFGKAVLGMAVETEKILQEHLVSGILSVPVGILDTFKGIPHLLPTKYTKLEVLDGAANNLPDEKALTATRKIEALVRSLNEDSILIVLISGGGSALLPAPILPVTLQEKTETIKLLSSTGANIMELNSVRKRLSYLKGGGLAKLAYPAQVVALILSDVVGDDVSYIASGPTVENTDAKEAALNIVKKYNLISRIPSSVEKVLSNTLHNDINIPPSCQNVIIGNNSTALLTASIKSIEMGYDTVVLTRNIFGSVEVVSNAYILLATNICKFLNGQMSENKFLNSFTTGVYNVALDTDLPEKLLNCLYNFNTCKGLCLLAGGETTVHVKGKGKGGRNQELALLFSLGIQKACYDNPILHKYNLVLLSGGTDGVDGPTDAAGAMGYKNIAELAEKCDLDILEYLQNNDSYNFYQKLGTDGDLLITGHTGTNVMDIHILIIQNMENK